MKERFSFHKDFLETANAIKDKNLRQNYLQAVIEYGLEGKEPEDQTLAILLIPVKLEITRQELISKVRSNNMKGNKNSKKDWNKKEKQTKTEKLEKTETTEKTETKTKNRVDRSSQEKQKKQMEEMLDDNGEIVNKNGKSSIYSNIYSINNNLLNIVKIFINNKSIYPQISYQVNKNGFKKYLIEQYFYGIDLEQKIGFDNFKTLLKFCLIDNFWKDQILSVRKLLEKNKENIPYYVVLTEKVLHSNQNQSNVGHIPTV